MSTKSQNKKKQEEHRSKSPFQRFVKTGNKADKKLPIRDDRLPENIPFGSLLVGDKSNKIQSTSFLNLKIFTYFA